MELSVVNACASLLSHHHHHHHVNFNLIVTKNAHTYNAYTENETREVEKEERDRSHNTFPKTV